MALTKQSINLPFMGLDQKSDPFKVAPGKFLSLVNTIPIKGGPTGILLQKRNGFGFLPSLPDASNTFLTTFNGNLTAIGNAFNAYNESSQNWINKGAFYPVDLKTLPLIRNNVNQTQTDSAIEPNGLVCTAYTSNTPSGTVYQYVIADSITGQNIVSPTTFTATGSPRVYVLSSYFIVLYPNGTHLKYIAVPISNPTAPLAPVDVSTQLSYSSGGNFDAVILNNSLYVAWNGSDGGGAIRATYIDKTLTQHSTVVFAGKSATLLTVAADTTDNFFWIYTFATGPTSYLIALDLNLATVLGPTAPSVDSRTVNLGLLANAGLVYYFYEIAQAYTFDATIPTNSIAGGVGNSHGAIGASTAIASSIGLASKPFFINNKIYFLAAYQSNYQPTYFLMDSLGNVVSKLAYQNGGGYLTLGLPNVSILNETASVPYLYKDLITSVNKNTNVPSGTQINGIYAQLGINLASFNFATEPLSSSEIGNNLHLSGGFLWAYDGYLPVEQMFFLYPDLDLNADGTYHGLTTSNSGGFITAQTYFYQVTYEWSDNQGNLFRSAPSIPVKIVTTGATSTNTIKVPTLRLTYKIANPVKICVYRWSTAQQIYYQVTSITSPTLNTLAASSVTITDTLSDASILGNNILYTTGGVVENIGPPATFATTLYKSRLVLVDSEDRNLLWFSKQVIESTPVEMSDLFTIYVAPTVGAQGDTGPITALSAMDDKLIIFKKDAIYYITGNGPDNTGANNDFSDPIFITSTVGCPNQASIVFMPQGLMFQSDKGIWLLGRDLSTSYIGAPVENFNSNTVLSAISIPGTNQVRFTLNNNVILMYDYYFGVWGSFQGNFAITSALYQSLHTFIDSFGRVFQETPGVYLDGANPTLISFTTGWVNVAGLQGYERLYDIYILGTYYSPHKLLVSIAYDYAPAPSQQSVISPNNYNAPWGGDNVWGNSTPYGGTPQLEEWRIHTQRQLCSAFQVTIQEVFDSSYGVSAGAGLTLSNMNLRLGIKKSVHPIRAANAVG